MPPLPRKGLKRFGFILAGFVFVGWLFGDPTLAAGMDGKPELSFVEALFPHPERLKEGLHEALSLTLSLFGVNP